VLLFGVKKIDDNDNSKKINIGNTTLINTSAGINNSSSSSSSSSSVNYDYAGYDKIHGLFDGSIVINQLVHMLDLITINNYNYYEDIRNSNGLCNCLGELTKLSRNRSIYIFHYHHHEQQQYQYYDHQHHNTHQQKYQQQDDDHQRNYHYNQVPSSINMLRQNITKLLLLEADCMKFYPIMCIPYILTLCRRIDMKLISYNLDDCSNDVFITQYTSHKSTYKNNSGSFNNNDNNNNNNSNSNNDNDYIYHIIYSNSFDIYIKHSMIIQVLEREYMKFQRGLYKLPIDNHLVPFIFRSNKLIGMTRLLSIYTNNNNNGDDIIIIDGNNNKDGKSNHYHDNYDNDVVNNNKNMGRINTDIEKNMKKQAYYDNNYNDNNNNDISTDNINYTSDTSSVWSLGHDYNDNDNNNDSDISD